MMKKYIALGAISIESFKALKYYTFFTKHLSLLFVISVAVKLKQYLKKYNQLRY